MRWLPLHTNPFDLGAHMEDDHGLEAITIEHMDADMLRRAHRVLHRENQSDHMHSEQHESHSE